MDETITLYRPTGPQELELVAASGYRRWPPRLPEQPIFYPVTNEAYAREIAERWNAQARRPSGAGFVTRFQVKKSFMDSYEIHQVGRAYHTEWWIPAEELEALNENIVGVIEVMWKADTSGSTNINGKVLPTWAVCFDGTPFNLDMRCAHLTTGGVPYNLTFVFGDPDSGQVMEFGKQSSK